MRATPIRHWDTTREGGGARCIRARRPVDFRRMDSRRDRQPRPRDWAARPRRRIDDTAVCAGPIGRPGVSAALRRLPPLATTGVGSLPFRRAQEAAEHAVAAYELPFCPQLPRLSGDMVTEWLGAESGRRGWAVARSPPEHGLVKLQVTGPVTLAVALERAARRTGRGEAVVELAAQIALW